MSGRGGDSQTADAGKKENPVTKDEIVRKHKEYLSNCVTNYYKDPLVIDHAKGQYACDIKDQSGSSHGHDL